jgi:hypothetical protein
MNSPATGDRSRFSRYDASSAAANVVLLGAGADLVLILGCGQRNQPLVPWLALGVG